MGGPGTSARRSRARGSPARLFIPTRSLAEFARSERLRKVLADVDRGRRADAASRSITFCSPLRPLGKTSLAHIIRAELGVKLACNLGTGGSTAPVIWLPSSTISTSGRTVHRRDPSSRAVIEGFSIREWRTSSSNIVVGKGPGAGDDEARGSSRLRWSGRRPAQDC